MNTLFEIIPSNFYAEDCSLVCQLNYDDFSCAIKNETDQEYMGVSVYHFDGSRSKSSFTIALRILLNSKEFLSRHYKKVIITFAVDESVLIPYALYDREQSNTALDLVHGDLDSGATLLTDVVAEHAVYNAFRVNTEVYHLLKEYFPEANMWHQYSALINLETRHLNRLYVTFQSHHMRVCLFLNGKCHLVNRYKYQRAEDVSYLLLSICQQFQTEDIELEISGFIEKDSSLYQELHKYFKTISFSKLPELCSFSDDLLKYPHHYFSHLYALDVCG